MIINFIKKNSVDQMKDRKNSAQGDTNILKFKNSGNETYNRKTFNLTQIQNNQTGRPTDFSDVNNGKIIENFYSKQFIRTSTIGPFFNCKRTPQKFLLILSQPLVSINTTLV